MPTILITGAHGQLGTILVQALADRYGADKIVATDMYPAARENPSIQYEMLDVLDIERLKSLIDRYNITQIYHLAAILSAKGEQHPMEAWNVNIQGLLNVLEAAREKELQRVFFPSTIAVFGPDAPRIRTPNNTILHPTTVYGIAKVAGESWCQYYHQHYGLDVRSVRYPGVVGWQSQPGGGTTDYAVEMFHAAVKGESYRCFLKPDTRLPMIYMDDAIRATLELMEASARSLSIPTSYNIVGMSFTPAELASAIRRFYPDFQVEYAPDFRQDIADNWPESVDDSYAKRDWGWRAEIGLEKMVREMVKYLT